MNAQVSTSGTTQNGNYSSAIGYYSYAGPGAVSTAMGRSTDATGWASTSMGGYTLASGQASTAMGYYSIAADWGSLAIGQYNLSNATANDADNFSTSNVAFVIGNGVDASNKSDAFKVMFNGDATVSGDLSIKGNDIYSSSAAAITLTGSNVSTLGDLTVTGNDITFGNGETISNGVNGTISLTSTDVSVSNNLSIAGDLSVGGTTITSTASELNLLDGVTTIGDGILASVTESSNTGVRLSTSNASNHGEIGDAAVDLSKQGASSTTRGATGYGSLASGYNTTASESYSTALGSYTVASGYGSTALGRLTTASGYYSTAMGRYTTASDYASVVIGRYNSSSSSATSADNFSTSNPAFVIGNGTASNAKSDAFKVMFNGDTTVSNDLTVSGDVVISSDARLKSNIVSLGSTLPKLLQIDGKSYEMKGKQKIGVLAQEIQEVFPELVSEDDNEMLAVNYQGLVPVLINALKDQQSEIDELKEMVQKLISEN